LGRRCIPARAFRDKTSSLDDNAGSRDPGFYDVKTYRQPRVRWATDARLPMRKMVVFAFREWVMENAVYWKGRQVGIECDGRISWFPSAPQEAVAAHCGEERSDVEQGVATNDSVVARNLVTIARLHGD
jgi:hypothetical protein